ncbi:MAG: RHS repeat-associated core domain-containing protein, partial [Saprospiraceae bacterium]
FQYRIADHLGNTVVFFEDRDGDTKIKTEPMTSDPDSLEVLQRNYYYPFGMEMEGPWQAATAPRADYLYNGKEWNEDLGLDWYDYGARWYDPTIGRWNAVDPLAEKYAAWSPYGYALDNPILLIDPDGRSVDTEIYNSSGKKVGEDEKGRDGNIAIVSYEVGRDLKKGRISASDAISAGIQTTRTALKESLDVITRTEKNGGDREESSVISENRGVSRGETGEKAQSRTIEGAHLPYVPGSNNTSIHSHPINGGIEGGKIVSYSAEIPGPGDPPIFQNYKQNIIVGRLGAYEGEIDLSSGLIFITYTPPLGAAFFDRNSNHLGSVQREIMEKIVKK